MQRMSQIFYGDGRSQVLRPARPQPRPVPALGGDFTGRTYQTNRPGTRFPTVAPQVVVASGPVFALVQPVTHTVETQPPAEAFHPQVEHHDVVSAGEGFLLIVIVILVAGWRWIIGFRPAG